MSHSRLVVWFGSPDSAKLRLFCFPYAGGGASVFSTWPHGLPLEIAVAGMQLPGRESRVAEEPFTRLAPLLEAIVADLSPPLDPPFAFFGHSMGALIAFELTRHLRRQGAPLPIHLLLSADRAPHLPSRSAPIHHLETGEFLTELRRLNGTPETVLANRELMEFLVPALRADFAICETYVYSPEDALDCPISCFGGRGDSEATREELIEWCLHTRGPFALHMLPGDHFYLHHSRQILLKAILRELTPYL